MPNHCINEIIFRAVDVATQDRILAKACNAEGKVDFEVLVPPPLTAWPGSVGQREEKAFPITCLDWARANWGTKWNAYDHHPIERGDDFLILRFETAWRPPYGWIVAIFNTFKLPFEHNWLSEGGAPSVSATWDYAGLEKMGGWKEVEADEAMHRHLHKLLWGCEKFEDEGAE